MSLDPDAPWAKLAWGIGAWGIPKSDIVPHSEDEKECILEIMDNIADGEY